MVCDLVRLRFYAQYDALGFSNALALVPVCHVAVDRGATLEFSNVVAVKSEIRALASDFCHVGRHVENISGRVEIL